MKRRIIIFVALLCGLSMYAQSDIYERRYDLLVSQFGPAGVGVETVLENWEKVDSTNVKMLVGKFSYFFSKSQTYVVESKPTKKYLGMDPMLALKDTTGKDVYYYQVSEFDDELYGAAIKAADKAISLYPDRLDFRFMKANAYIAYEKESPDMALAYLLSLVDENSNRKTPWNYEGEDVSADFFPEAIQEYCYSFYAIATDPSFEAFRTLSEKMIGLYPKNLAFVNNVGSYYMVAKKDYKNAIKYYNKVLKSDSDDLTAIKNGIIAARRSNNIKQEKKYLELMLKYGSEKEHLQAQARLDALGK